MYSVADCTSKWFENNFNDPILRDWRGRKGNPIIFECDLIELVNTKIPLDDRYKREAIYFCDLPSCICFGPVWEKDGEYYKNIYNTITYA